MKSIKTLLKIFAGLFLGLLILLFIANYKFIGLTKAIYGINYKTEKTIFKYDPERDFHGDGFSITIDSVLENEIVNFEKTIKSRPNVYPKRHYHLGKFEIIKWKQTPFSISDSIPVNFATAVDGDIKLIGNEEVIKYLKKSKNMLEESGNYYALFFRDHPYKLYGVDIFIVCPRNNEVIAINKQ
jgi:hypothetical protein